ncbi:MAG: hypothetical protein Fur0035_22300 [Anaerolineales bacterium]
MPTPGQTLRAARENKKLSLKQVFQATRIRQHYLEAMEADDLSSLPSAAQSRGFLRAYAEFLGIDAAELFPRPEPAPAPGEDSPPQPASPAAAESTPAPEAAAAESAPQPENPPADESAPRADPASDAILHEIGVSLRLRREALSLTLEEIERHTRIRKTNLQYLETGALNELASPVQARGMLNAYAAFLDMNSEALLLRFAEALQARRAERQPAPAPKRQRPAPSVPPFLRRFISPDLIFGAAMIIIFFGLVVWGAVRIFEPGANAQATEGPSISDVLLATPSAQAAPTSQNAAALEELATPIVSGAEFPTEALTTPTPLPGTIVQITLLISERTLLRVLVDGELKLNERVAPGAALTFEGSQSVEVLTGNGAAVQVLFNQLDQGRMGSLGEVVHRIYTLNGVTTPTPLPSLTPSNTPRFQRSPTPTSTPTLAPVVEP